MAFFLWGYHLIADLLEEINLFCVLVDIDYCVVSLVTFDI